MNSTIVYERKKRCFHGKLLIESGSLYEQIVADFTENGHGIRGTTNIVNLAMKMDGYTTTVGEICVRDCILRLNPNITKIMKISQGSDDPHSNWAKASVNLIKQLLICFNVLDVTITLDPPMPAKINNDVNLTINISLVLNDDIFQPYFDKDKLEITQIAWFDETHRECDLRSSDSMKSRG